MADYDIIELRKKDSGDVFYPLTHVDAVIGLTDQSFFMKDASGNVTLKPQYQNLWVPGWLAAGGVGTGGGGGGGATYLYELQDVGISSPQPGHLLMYDPTQEKPWVNVPQSQIVPDLSGYGHSLSLSNTATYLLDSNGKFLLDSQGKYLVSSVSSTSINLLNGSGTVLSSVTLPTQVISSLSVTIGSATVSLGGSATLTQIGIPTWAQSLNKPSYNFSEIGNKPTTLQGYGITDAVPSSRTINGVDLSQNRTFYVGTSAIQSSPAPQNLEGISSFKLSASESLVKYENNAWHFYGNVYADGWIAAGGVGTGGGGGGSTGSFYDLSEIAVDTASLSSNQVLKYDGTHWTNTELKTINNTSIIGSGNITVSGGGGSYSAGTGISISSGTISLKVASATSIGGMKVNSVITTPSVNSPSTTAGKYYYVQCDSNGLAFVNVPWVAGSSGGGTLTEVGLTMPTCFSVSGSPLTSDGAISVDFTSQTSNYVLAAPSNASGKPSFRALVADDIPSLSGTYVTLATAQTISGAKTFSAATTFSSDISVGGVVNVNSLNTIDQSISNSARFNYGGRSTKAFNAYGTSINIHAYDSNGDEQNIFSVNQTVTLVGKSMRPNYNASGVNLGSGANDGGRWATIYGNNLDLAQDLTLAATSHIDIGPVRIVYDSASDALHITTNDSTNHPTISIYADGFVAAGGVQASS